MDLGTDTAMQGVPLALYLVCRTRVAWMLQLWCLLLAVRRIPSDKKGGAGPFVQAGDNASQL